jgi:tRNA pseudouridine38-40 synthase
MRRALNALLPDDIWVAAAHAMRDEFHARYSAVARRYSYYVGTDEGAASPFRRRTEWRVNRAMDRDALHRAAATIAGEHAFRGFAVRGTAPPDDDHRCRVLEARWRDREDGPARGLVFEVEANRFLHHMVRFLVGTMIDVAIGRRPFESFTALLAAGTNDDVSAPAPAHALFLDQVRYPAELYLSDV